MPRLWGALLSMERSWDVPLGGRDWSTGVLYCSGDRFSLVSPVPGVALREFLKK